jgi:mannosyltransferase OCH1-like enzyme
MIPKIIWQTHEWEYEDLPIYFVKTSMSWINLNPGYKYVYVTSAERENFIKLNYPHLYAYYKYLGSIDKRHQCCAWRFLILNERGGFYSDMDSTCIKPLDYVLKDFKDNHEFVTLKRMTNPGQRHIDLKIDRKIMTNDSNLGSIPNSNFLKDIIKHMETDAKKINFIEKTNEFILDKSVMQGLWMPWDIFNLNLEKNSHTRLIDHFAHHSDYFKKDFMNMDQVDYYGEKISYLELIKKQGLKEY